jgi:protein-S-isoprenylcysteine O-methyltransferase Ste14
MSQNNKVWKFAAFTLVLFILAITIFPLSIYFGEQTKDPDKYEAPAWFASLGLLFLSVIFGGVTLQMWLIQRNQTNKLFKDS